MFPQSNSEEGRGLHPQEVMSGGPFHPPSLGQVVFDPLPALGEAEGSQSPLCRRGHPRSALVPGPEPPRTPYIKLRHLSSEIPLGRGGCCGGPGRLGRGQHTLGGFGPTGRGWGPPSGKDVGDEVEEALGVLLGVHRGDLGSGLGGTGSDPRNTPGTEPCPRYPGNHPHPKMTPHNTSGN